MSEIQQSRLAPLQNNLFSEPLKQSSRTPFGKAENNFNLATADPGSIRSRKVKARNIADIEESSELMAKKIKNENRNKMLHDMMGLDVVEDY